MSRSGPASLSAGSSLAPPVTASEAAHVPDLTVCVATSLVDVVRWVAQMGELPQPPPEEERPASAPSWSIDGIRDQALGKRALQCAEPFGRNVELGQRQLGQCAETPGRREQDHRR